jgi:hypothetical protein
MSEVKLRAAQELLREKQYVAAKHLLETMPENDTAQKWLKQLNNAELQQSPSPSHLTWEYCELFWRLVSWKQANLNDENFNDIADLNEAVYHNFALWISFFPQLSTNSKDHEPALKSSTEKQLIVFNEKDTPWASVVEDDLLMKLYKRDLQRFREVQFQALFEMIEWISEVPKAYIAQKGDEGWELVNIYEREYEFGELHENVQEVLGHALRLRYVMKRRKS